MAENDGRLVKLIGDEVMYVADDPGAICQVTVALLDAFDGGDILPPLRAGLACGPVLVRDGDYFGPVVNIASRSAKLGRPRTALVTPDVRTRSPEPPPGYRYGPARPRRLKGFDRRVPLHTLRRERTRRHPLRAVEAILGAGAEP